MNRKEKGKIMKSIEYYIVDVFAEQKFSGNQLAVFFNAENLTSKQMQIIAKEMNYSETTFILKQNSDSCFSVRIFTPEEEVSFAGHPTLGTAYVINEFILKNKLTQITLRLKAGDIPVSFNDNPILFMKQNQPEFGDENYKLEDFAQLFYLKLSDFDDKYPINDVSTGLRFIIVPLKKLEIIKKIEVNLSFYNSWVKTQKCKLFFLFCPQTYNKNHQLNSRMFAHYFSIPEDPATGSANGCLAAYLLKYNYFKKDYIDIKVEQGYEINRPSTLYLKSSKKNENFDINVGGKVQIISKGELYL